MARRDERGAVDYRGALVVKSDAALNYFHRYITLNPEKAGLRDGFALGIAAEPGLNTDETLERFALKRGTKWSRASANYGAWELRCFIQSELKLSTTYLRVLGIKTACIPAALAASRPLLPSSRTRHSLGRMPMRSAASRNMSGAGLPCFTSFGVMMVSKR
jgi:hypothetical protein